MSDNDPPIYTVGDLERPLSGRLRDGDDPVDASAAELVHVHVRRPSGSSIARQAEFIDKAAGTWRMPWVEGDLVEDGPHDMEVQVTWAGGRTQTFGPAWFFVRDQLG